MYDFTPFPILETERLILRRMVHHDALDLFEMRKNPRMNEHIDAKLDESIDETKAYIDKMNQGIDDNKWIIWAMEHKQLGKVIGSISIWNLNDEEKSGELGYGIIPDFQGRGLMKESLLSVVKYGFDEMHLEKMDAYTEENNIRSIKLLESCDFVDINRTDDQGFFNNRVYHMIVYRVCV